MSAAADNRGTDARRSAQFMRPKAHVIDAETMQIDWHLAGRLHRITQCTKAPPSAPTATSATGWITPVSLLASMTEARRTRRCRQKT